jgi:hypothetical protein
MIILNIQSWVLRVVVIFPDPLHKFAHTP